MYGTSQPKIGELLVSSGLITPEQRDHLLEVQKEKGGKFGELAIAEEMITEDDLLNILSSQLNIPVVNLEEAIIDPKVPLLLPSKIAQRYSMLPIEETENKIVIAVADPTNIQGIDDAKMMLNKDVELVLCRKADLLRNIDDYYGGVESVQELLEGITEDDIELVKDEADLTGNGAADIEDNRIVKYVNLIILEAIKNHASDVHLEPFENEFVIRQRIDGVLHKMPAPPKQVQNAVISRIKVMADLNIAESRLPQDGRIKLRLAGKEIDLRVSSLPTVFGESVVLRLLDRTAQILTLEQLGMSDETRIKMEKIIENPNGIVVVTGPTGCGKTSSLYACVVKLHNPEDKFITVEDPVEYEIDTLTQVQVHEKVGLTFGATLRSILRQDPDII
ncbi:TPA: type II secretion system protein GspE, partial [bacterium]|nr:type II secretion system protein GspE [bacterium]